MVKKERFASTVRGQNIFQPQKWEREHCSRKKRPGVKQTRQGRSGRKRRNSLPKRDGTGRKTSSVDKTGEHGEEKRICKTKGGFYLCDDALTKNRFMVNKSV